MRPPNRKQSVPVPVARESHTPLEVTALRFGVKPFEVADPRIAAAIAWKTRLDAKCKDAVAPNPAFRAHMIARIRATKGFKDEPLSRAVESLIGGVADSLIFLGKLRPRFDQAQCGTDAHSIQPKEMHRSKSSL
jgi:hypothetical protein